MGGGVGWKFVNGASCQMVQLFSLSNIDVYSTLVQHFD